MNPIQIAIRNVACFLPLLMLPLWQPQVLRASQPESESSAAKAAAIEYFEKHVRPLFIQHCYECHSAGEENGGLRLDSARGVLEGGDTGPAIVAGDPEKSLLIEAIRYQNRDLQMPPEGALPKSLVAILEKWIAMGAHDPRVDLDAETAPGPVGMSVEEGREFWSLKPLANPAIPHVKNSSWVKTPIDAFVLARLEQNGLQPAPSADRLTLLRRVTHDLIGLPPTPDEIRDFLADESPQAWNRVVDRLLKSPHYGIRWGRHWLDVARYADSNGLDENLAMGNAWRYRDYVIDAFNRDKPFDRFVIEQLAGDLLPDANRETKTATGFLVLGAKVLAEPDMEKLVMDTVDEQLDTTGKAFMAMTIGCSRCHDHKFDPLKQNDYYALAAIFKSTKTFSGSATGAIKHWNEILFASEDQLAQLKDVDSMIAQKKKAASSFKSSAISKLRQAARAKATEYLVACTKFEPAAPLTRVERIAQPSGLHPRILHHCRLHLDYHRDDPFFRKWHDLAAQGEGCADAVEQHYRPLFEGAQTASEDAGSQDARISPMKSRQLRLARAALNDPSGFLAVPAKPEHAFDKVTLTRYYELMEEARIVESKAPDPDAAMGVQDAEILTSLSVHIRGSHRNLGSAVARGFPEVMRARHAQPVLPAQQSGRMELARWLASPNHPLTARVYVNRVWRWHFGTGIVASTENFGKLGDRPSHPELLDWLAQYFIQSSWSTKELHRLITASNCYQISTRHPDELHGPVENGRLSKSQPGEIDPENRLLWKFRVQRLEAEQIRDSILAASGRLDESIGGKTIPLRNRQFVFNHTSIDHTKYDSLRRAIYLPVVRNNLYTLFEQFDFPDPTMPTGSRNATVVAPQALLLLNSDLVMDSADHLARLLLEQEQDDLSRVEAAYHRTLCRPPTEAETQRALEFIHELTSHALINAADIDPVQQEQAWSLLCQSLFASNEFIYLR